MEPTKITESNILFFPKKETQEKAEKITADPVTPEDIHEGAEESLEQVIVNEERVRVNSENIDSRVRVNPENIDSRVRVNSEGITLNQNKILEEIKKNKYITSNQLAHIIGISDRKILANIKKLKEKGLLRRIGSDKKGYWEIIEDNGNQIEFKPDLEETESISSEPESVSSNRANFEIPDSNPEFDINWELDINQQVTRQKNKKSKKKFDEEHARKLGLEPEEVQIGGETKILYMSKDYKENKRKEEAKGGIWVGVKEYAEVKRIKKSTVFRRIKKEFKYIIAIDPKTNQHVLLLLIGKRDTKEAIFKYRQSQQIELLVPRKELLNMHKNGAIDLNIFDSLLSVPQKATLRLKGYLRKEILNTVWKHIKISEIKPEMDCPSQT